MPSSSATPVAIVIPCRDDGIYLRDAVRSAQCQTHPEVEIVVVDDGSTDPQTLEVFAALEAEGQRVLHLPPSGLPAARNAGISATTAPYILPLDSDDLFDPGYATAAAEILDSDPEVGIVGCAVRLFGTARGVLREPEFTMAAMLRLDYTILPASMFRRADWEAVGGYDEAFTRCEDTDLWFSILSLGRQVRMLDDVLLHYRKRSGSMTDAQYRALFETARGNLMRKHWDLYDRYAEDFWSLQLARVHALQYFKRRFGRANWWVDRVLTQASRLRVARG